MVIKETAIFTRIIQEIMSDEEYVSLQERLIFNPENGDLISGSAGLRKIRWKIPGKGKRSGVRIIYYFLNKQEQIFMLYAYQKNKQDNVTKDHLKKLIRLVKEELEE